MSLQDKYDDYQATIRSLQEHMTTIESQIYEHELVLSTLKNVPSTRRAWKLTNNAAAETEPSTSSSTNGALIETNAGDAATSLQNTLNGLNTLLNKVNTEVDETRKEFNDWKTKNNIKIVQG